MARTASAMVDLGTVAPDFALLDAISGRQVDRVSLLAGPEPPAGAVGQRPLLLMFVCAHCPYVQHIEQELGRLGRDFFGQHGEGPVAIAAVQPNDTAQYPADGPDGMRAQAQRLGWTFPYLLDDTQDVARSYGAVCTPDFFLFDRDLRLAYRGQLDDSRPRRGDAGNDEPVTGRDLRAALAAVMAGQVPSPAQRSSIGCSIKWREAPPHTP